MLKLGPRYRSVISFTYRPLLPPRSARYPLNRALGRPRNQAGRYVAKDNVTESCCSTRLSLNVAVDRATTWILFSTINTLHISAYDRTFRRILCYKLL
jgi:hypothetical protein